LQLSNSGAEDKYSYERDFTERSWIQKDHGCIHDIYCRDYAIKMQKKYLGFFSIKRQENSSILSYFNIKKLWNVMRSIVYVLLLR